MTPSFPRPADPAECTRLSTIPARSPRAGRLLAIAALAIGGLLSVAGCRGGDTERAQCQDCPAETSAPAKLPAAPPDGVKECVQTCSRAVDCTSPRASPLYDASHFNCADGRCEYTGCKNTAECTAAYGEKTVCEAAPGPSIAICVPTCSAPADCAEPRAPALYDASHFTCVRNRCEYTGCKSAAECTAAYGEKTVCEARPGSPIPVCVPTCSAPADCAKPGASGLYDASHFTCVQGRCQHTGCRGTAECTATFGDGMVCE
jgi:hypothetical protein